MKIAQNIFLEKKILIYGLGKSGISSFKFLKDLAKIYLFDDNLKMNKSFNQKFINLTEITKVKVDIIIISPGIDISNCKLSKFLKKNNSKIFTDLDVFYSFYKNKSITVTGTNGKSTTAKILHDVLLDQKKDVRLVGNIGNPILNERKIKKETIFVSLENLPEIILPAKEENAGYQYELLIKYLDSLNKKKVKFNDSKFDLKIFYSKDICEKCIVINNQDLLLVSNDYVNEGNDVEIIETFQKSLIDNAIIKNYKMSYVSNDLDDLIYNLSKNLISHTIITRSSYLFYKKYYPNYLN